MGFLLAVAAGAFQGFQQGAFRVAGLQFTAQLPILPCQPTQHLDKLKRPHNLLALPLLVPIPIPPLTPPNLQDPPGQPIPNQLPINRPPTDPHKPLEYNNQMYGHLSRINFIDELLRYFVGELAALACFYYLRDYLGYGLMGEVAGEFVQVGD